MTFAFDVDGTLIEYMKDSPRWEVVAMLKTLKKAGHTIIVWSGGGKDYAEVWGRRLFLNEFVDCYSGKPIGEDYVMSEVDVCFDDEEVKLAKCNIQI